MALPISKETTTAERAIYSFIPPEILTEILSNNVHPTESVDSLSASLVCRAWRDTGQACLWEQLSIQGEGKAQAILASPALGSYRTKMVALGPSKRQSLSFVRMVGGGFPRAIDELLGGDVQPENVGKLQTMAGLAQKILEKLVGIRQLALMGLGTLPTSVLSLPSLAGLKSLTVDAIVFSGTPIPPSFALTSLTICMSMPDNYLRQVVWFLPAFCDHLTTLNLDYRDVNSMLGLVSQTLRSSKVTAAFSPLAGSLKSLTLNNAVLPNLLPSLHLCRALKHLEMGIGTFSQLDAVLFALSRSTAKLDSLRVNLDLEWQERHEMLLPHFSSPLLSRLKTVHIVFTRLLWRLSGQQAYDAVESELKRGTGEFFAECKERGIEIYFPVEGSSLGSSLSIRYQGPR